MPDLSHSTPDTSAMPREPHDSENEWIATYAYFLAESRGFVPEFVLDDWLAAERAYREQGLAKGESD